MNRTIKDETVKRYHYDSHDQLRQDLDDFVSAYNFGRRLKTLKGLTPYEYICKIWTAEPRRFRLSPIRQMPGLNTLALRGLPGSLIHPLRVMLGSLLEHLRGGILFNQWLYD